VWFRLVRAWRWMRATGCHAGAGLLLALSTVPAGAQQSGRTYRIGFLGGAVGSGVIAQGYPAFRDELRKRGFIDGRNLAVDFRSTQQEPGRNAASRFG
jgi:hypothetical protein